MVAVVGTPIVNSIVYITSPTYLSAAAMIPLPTSSVNLPFSRLYLAQHFFKSACACTMGSGILDSGPPIGKFFIERWVWQPQSTPEGIDMEPMLSFSSPGRGGGLLERVEGDEWASIFFGSGSSIFRWKITFNKSLNSREGRVTILSSILVLKRIPTEIEISGLQLV